MQRAAAALTRFAERWIPDAFVFALVATVVVFVCGLAIGTPVVKLVRAWGDGLPDLLPFAMQMTLVIVTGYVLATSPPVFRLIRALADRSPRSPRGAVAFVTAFALASAWLNWGFSLVFSSVLARAVARRRPGVDYRALGAASLLGLGSIWAQGLSGSAALQMATPSALQPPIREVIANGGAIPGGVVDLSHTIFLWQSVVAVLVEIAIVTLVMWLAAPTGDRVRDAAACGVTLDEDLPGDEPPPGSPGERLERSRVLVGLIVLLGGAYLVLTLKDRGVVGLTVDTINLTMLLAGMAAHGTPARLMRAVRAATPAAWGVILQFPFYAAIAKMIVASRLSAHVANAFVSISTPRTFPATMSAYSAALGVFVPSGGSKWVIEAPYVIAAAHRLRVHIGWVVACYDLGEALANLLQPFWMLPVLALLKLRARDVMGFTFLVFLVLAPVVLILTTVLAGTLAYPL
jgi:short-chain fatty acids transporter